jgi:hypothetical protein
MEEDDHFMANEDLLLKLFLAIFVYWLSDV